MKKLIVILTTSYLLLATAKYWLADYFYAKEDVASLEKAVALSPAEAIYHDKLATEYAQFAPELAAAELEKSINLSPRNVKLLKSAASTYDDMGNQEKALEIYQKLSELAPTDAQVWYQLALTYAKLKNFDESKAILAKVLVIKPDYELARKLKNSISTPPVSPSNLEGD